MVVGSMLDWANANAPAITAIATIFLVLITAVYVVVTYLLVREQRAQKQFPDVQFHLTPRAEGDQGLARADLKIKNVGNATATEVTFLQGFRDGIQVQMPRLGRRTVLLPGEDQVVKIRPPAGVDKFAEGDLPLILSYSDNSRSMMVFEILLLVFERPEDGGRVRNIGSMEDAFTKRKLKRLALSVMPFWARPAFLWEERQASVLSLLLHPKVRDALRLQLEETLNSLRRAGEQMMEMRQQL